jgi:L-aspartate oxidase
MTSLENSFNTIIVGSGLAGLNLARKLAQAGQKIFICSKEAITEGSSKYAQGGVAVVSPLNPEDNVDSHILDTLESGKGLCNETVVREILSAGWKQVSQLISLGVEFDKSFNLEGSHSYKRVMHVGDTTGRSLIKPLINNISRNELVQISQGTELISLIKNTNTGRVCGVRLMDISGNDYDVFADNVVLACGGLAGLYQEYTCPGILRGDAIALAYDAGAKIENLEFVQFHPTVFKTKSNKNFLISEALRGAGAQLRNSQKELFAQKYHPQAELATRDIVSRAIYSEMNLTNSDFIYLDARHLGREFLEREFPMIYKSCVSEGYDLAQDLLPVRPAAHYSIGGIKTDLQGKTNLKGLYAIGECASNGLHGANRLASNSLLEAIVVSDFTAEDILAQETVNLDSNPILDYCSNYFIPFSFKEKQEHEKTVALIRSALSSNLGLERRQKSMQSALKFLESLPDSKERTTAILLTQSALQRKESRGVHYRLDAPSVNPNMQFSTIVSKFSLARESSQSKTSGIVSL